MSYIRIGKQPFSSLPYKIDSVGEFLLLKEKLDKRARCIVFLFSRNYNEPSCNSRREIMEAIMRMEAIDRQLDRARRGEPEALSSLYRTHSFYKGGQ